MDTIRFKAITCSGLELVGPIRGVGGMLGSAALHLTNRKSAEQIAFDRLDCAQRRAERSCHSGFYEPRPGCVAIYPDFSAQGDGKPVAVPLLGTEFSIADRENGGSR